MSHMVRCHVGKVYLFVFYVCISSIAYMCVLQYCIVSEWFILKCLFLLPAGSRRMDRRLQRAVAFEYARVSEYAFSFL